MARLETVARAWMEFWGALCRVRRNPFFLREVWDGRRSRNASHTRAVFAAVVCCWCGILAGAFLEAGYHQQESWGWFVAAGSAWCATLALFAASDPSTTFHRDRQAGTEGLLACSPVNPLVEMVGRWVGGTLPAARIWLAGLGLVFMGGVLERRSPACHVGQSSGDLMSFVLALLAAWIAVGAATAVLTALSVAAASVVEKPPLAVGVALGVFILFTASMVTSPLGSAVYHKLSTRYAACHPYPGSPDEVLAVAAATLLGVALAAWLVSGLLTCAGFLVVRRRRLACVTVRSARSTRSGRFCSRLASGAPSCTGLVDWLMSSQRTNPFYSVWRQGHLRLQARFTVNAFPPLIVGLALLVYVQAIANRYLDTIAHEPTEDPILAGVLVAGVVVASLISGCEAWLLSARTIRSEQEQSTWPLILVSGARPERLVAGRFCTCFHALSREWTLVLPLWIVAGMVHPPVLLLAVVQPAVIALASMMGLASVGGDPTVNGAVIPRAGGLIYGGFFLLSTLKTGTFFALVSPAVGAGVVSGAMALHFAQLAGAAMVWIVFRHYAVKAVGRMMVEV